MASINTKQAERLQKEIFRLEAEMKAYQKAGSLKESYDRFMNDIKSEEANDPFSTACTKPNPFHAPPGGTSGCCG